MEYLQEICFQTLRLRISTYPSTIWDKSSASYARTLANYSMSALAYEPPTINSTKKKCRKKSVTWFNPPYSKNVKSNIGRDFLKLLDTAFPPTNPLHKLFTRHTVKLSYSCMPNMAQAVARHNSKILNEDLNCYFSFKFRKLC